jgi:hypothetical protein
MCGTVVRLHRPATCTHHIATSVHGFQELNMSVVVKVSPHSVMHAEGMPDRQLHSCWPPCV